MQQADSSEARTLGRPVGDAGRSDGLWLALLGRIVTKLQTGSLVLHDDRGVRSVFDGNAPGVRAEIRLSNTRAARRLLTGGDIGFAEAYVDGDWDTPDLVAVIRLALRNDSALRASLRGLWPLRALYRLVHLSRANTRRGSARNIAYHYDLGNSFYAAWLDAGMSYSSALFSRDDETLEEAQNAKIRRVIELADLRGGERVLEIGIGWGALAEELIRSRCRLVGITLSREQLAYARARLGEAIVAGHADLRIEDYRDCAGTFDRIVSIEMLEAVGRSNLATYFETLAGRLRPAGRAVLQTITIAEDRFASYSSETDFIQRHIFPGGFLPSASIVRAHAARAGLILRAQENFGESYARTLAEWRSRFNAAWPSIRAMGFDERFRRMWNYYLAYCEGGFREGSIDVGLYVFDQG
jgi:cyclopropane-fatty-acyl-phospholipid synthase